jgi:hypothetical protein
VRRSGALRPVSMARTVLSANPARAASWAWVIFRFQRSQVSSSPEDGLRPGGLVSMCLSMGRAWGGRIP